MINVIFFSLIGGLFSLLGALIIFRDKNEALKIAKFATPFAAGVLLGAAFADLLPEAIHQVDDVQKIMVTSLAAFLAFFFLERYLHFFHHHREHKSGKVNSSLIIIGDTLHNALDGIAIGAAFLISPPTGIIAALAVAVHEIPQEIGDFGLLLNNGMKRNKVIIVNVLSALSTTLTAVITYSLGSDDGSYIPYLLAITAGFFIYIAATDIIPEIQHRRGKKIDIGAWLVLVGAVLVIILSPIVHEYIDSGHDHENDNHIIDNNYENEKAHEEDHEEEHHIDEHEEDHK